MSLAKQIMVYGVGGAASKLAAVLLVPLYTRTLPVDDYGNLEVLLALHALAVLTAGLQSESAVARDYFEAQRSGTVARLLWGSLLLSALGTILLIAAALIGAALGLIPVEITAYLPLLLAMTLPAQLLGIQLVVIRFHGTPVRFAILSFLDLALSALFSAFLILQLEMGIGGALAGILGAKLVCGVLAWPATFKWPSHAAPGGERLRDMLAYSLPTMPSVLLNWAQSTGSRALLALFVPLSQVAIAGIAIKVAALYGFIIYSFRLAWEPYAFERLASSDRTDIYQRVFQWYVIAMLLAAGATMIVTPLIVAVLAPPVYAEAASLVAFFVLGQFWVGAISILSIGVHGARATSRLSYIYGAGAALNVAILAVAAPYFGIAAAGAASLVGSILSALLAAYYSERLYALNFSWRLLTLASIGTILFAGLGSALEIGAQKHGPTLELRILIGAAIATALFGLLLMLGRFGFDAHSRKVMQADLAGAISRKAAPR